jgi:hypothetical protein
VKEIGQVTTKTLIKHSRAWSTNDKRFVQAAARKKRTEMPSKVPQARECQIMLSSLREQNFSQTSPVANKFIFSTAFFCSFVGFCLFFPALTSCSRVSAFDWISSSGGISLIGASRERAHTPIGNLTNNCKSVGQLFLNVGTCSGKRAAKIRPRELTFFGPTSRFFQNVYEQYSTR